MCESFTNETKQEKVKSSYNSHSTQQWKGRKKMGLHQSDGGRPLGASYYWF